MFLRALTLSFFEGGSNPHPLRWKGRVSAAGLLGKPLPALTLHLPLSSVWETLTKELLTQPVSPVTWRQLRGSPLHPQGSAHFSILVVEVSHLQHYNQNTEEMGILLRKRG